MATDNKGVLENQIDDDFILDDIEDMPGFVVPPTGAYIVVLEKGIDTKEINDGHYYEIPMTIKEVVEVSDKALDDGEQLPKEGDIASLIFKRDNAFGMGNFKNFVRSISEKFGVTKVGEIREHAKGLEMLVVVKRKYDKEKDRHNINVTKSQVL